MGVRAALAILLLFIAAAKAHEGGATFWRKTFELTCPEVGNWFGKEDLNVLSVHYTAEYDNKNKGPYYCQWQGNEDQQTPRKYYFYVQGKVCENCFELDASLFALAIVVDVVGTAAVMLIICRCTKKKISAGPTHTSKTPARSGGRAPPVPSPDYEQLNAHTRSQDTYSIVNRTG